MRAITQKHSKAMHNRYGCTLYGRIGETYIRKPFHGITTGGVVRPGLFSLQDKEVPIRDIALAVDTVLKLWMLLKEAG
jgi:hypothetical protein